VCTRTSGRRPVIDSTRPTCPGGRTVPAAPRRAAPGPASLLLLCALLAGPGCRDTRAPVVVEKGRITFFNTTGDTWTDLEIRVNGYYVVPLASLGPHGRFDLPVTRLQGGFGRYFDPKRERVRTVVVRGATDRGEPVELRWEAAAPEG
jgi:hypothetical protein